MSKEVVIKGAEVVPFYNTTDTVREHSTDKGTVINFQVKTKINDRVERSPHLYEPCYIWLKSQEQVDTIKSMLKAGNILQISGTEDQTKYEKDGKTQFKRQIRVTTVTPIVVDAPEEVEVEEISDEDLPF